MNIVYAIGGANPLIRKYQPRVESNSGKSGPEVKLLSCPSGPPGAHTDAPVNRQVSGQGRTSWGTKDAGKWGVSAMETTMTDASLWRDILVIFSAQVIYVTMMTVRWILLLKGHRYPAAVISVFEVIIYVYALGLVVSQLGDFTRLLFYALGYAAGQLVGSKLEELLAVGYTTVQVVAQSPTQLPHTLRQHGFGVTTWQGTGRDGNREVLFVVLQRRRTGELFGLIEEYEPAAFALLMEPRSFRGGFLTKRMRAVPGPPGPPTSAGPAA